ncbi:MAG: hypothetical protein GF383_01615 [Candidatus Lokiarchaeota archaeon]|nr:hypothetical protein [Candidatus Lokiarchaeota archaeon]MBD3337994.1 hypothetical protein [Candidatus Lokiarchaeota archaeon]
MSEKIKENITKIQDYFKGLTNFIELEDFRSYLLFTLTSQIPSNLLAQIGLGGNKDVINLPYNPVTKTYYQKINLISPGALIAYVKSDPIKDEFIIDKEDPVFKEYLSQNEMSIAFRGKEKFLIPKVCDCSTIEGNNDEDEKLTVKIDDYFYSLESFIAMTEPNILFVINGKTEIEPDLLFTFNMMPQFPGKLKKNYLKIDTFLDEEHKTREKNYIKREEDYSLILMEDLKEISHAELYKSSFSLIIRIKSFQTPY